MSMQQTRHGKYETSFVWRTHSLLLLPQEHVIILPRDYNKQDNQQQDAFQIPVGRSEPTDSYFSIYKYIQHVSVFIIILLFFILGLSFRITKTKTLRS